MLEEKEEPKFVVHIQRSKLDQIKIFRHRRYCHSQTEILLQKKSTQSLFMNLIS